uniref:DNA damage-regulated autophagy modulator protein 2 n=1 Tax=Panagrolaimus sp. JU765 TaxID=591449 RepID=A0AC34R0Q8_9BILA
MAFHYLWIFPILSTGFAIAAFIAGYSIAVGNNDASAWFMYISDGGAHPPESCVFGQLLNLSALFLVISSYLRHRQYVVFYGDYHLDRHGRWRTISFLLMLVGFVSAFGMSLVANFQETSVALVHFIGAMMAFFGAAIFCWGQIFLSYALTPYMTPLWLNHFRTVLTAIGTGALVLHMICEQAQPFVKTVNGIKPTEPPKDDGIQRYDKDSPFYTNHLVTTCAEWGLALAFETVVLTFAWEMRQFYARLPKLFIKEEHFVAPIITSMETTKIIQTNGNLSTTETSSTQSSRQIIPRARMTAKVAPRNNKRNEYVY